MKPTTHPSPFAGCGTEAEIRAQLDALNRMYVGVQRIAEAREPVALRLPNWTRAPQDCRLNGR